MSVRIRIHLATDLPPVVLQTVKECLRLLGATDLYVPRFRIANHLHVKWNGLCTHIQDEPTTTITLQKRILNDERTCARVVAHEMCHHVEFLRNPNIYEDGHGPTFLKYAAIINNALGHNFVTTESDKDYVIDNTKDFYVLIFPVQEGKFAWQVAGRLTKDMEDYVRMCKFRYGCKFFKTKDRRLWRTPNLGSDKNYHTLQNNSEIQKILKDLYGVRKPQESDSDVA